MTLLNPPLTTARKIEICFILFVLVIGALFLHGYLAEKAASAQADTFAKAKDAQVDQLSQQLSASKAEASTYQAQMAKAAAKVTTPQQAVKIITRYLPAQPTPAGAPSPAAEAIPVIPANELDKAALDQLPPAPDYAILTPDQAVAVAKNDLQCEADRHSLTACTQQLTTSQQISALNKAEAGKYKQALAGGTIKQRIGRELKSAGCSAAGAVIAAFASRGSPSQYPATAAGAAGGAIVCSLF